MKDKGYPHPLYSLDLCSHHAEPEDEPRYSLLLPEGRLVVRAELRRRAQDHGVLGADRLVGTVLAYQRLAPAAFERFGLGPAWAGSMQHWRTFLLERDQERMGLKADREQAVAAAKRLVGEGRDRWGRLVLSARLAGLLGLVAAGAAPEGAAALREALVLCAARAGEPVHRALLAQSGFGEAERAALMSLLDRLPELTAARAAAEGRARAAADAVLVVRAALIGDATRFCQVAKEVLGAERCRALRVTPLLGRARKSPARTQPAAGS